MDWTFLFSHKREMAGAWIEQAFLWLLLAPWALLLLRSHATRRIAATLVALLLLIDRLRWDLQLWTVLACALAVAAFLFQRLRSRPPRPDRQYVVFVLLTGALAAWACWSPGRLSVSLALASLCLSASLPDLRFSELTPARIVTALILGGLLQRAGEGLDRDSLLIFLIAGLIGWLCLQFALWRGSRQVQEPRGIARRSRLAGVMAGTVGAMLGVEVYFRHIYDYSDANGELRTSRRHLERHGHFNRQGFRDREFPDPARLPPGPRIVLLGDSFAFGIGIRNRADQLGAQLEGAVRRSGFPDAQVYTVARGGANTALETQLLRTNGLPLAPHLVVLAYHLNDTENTHFTSPPSRARLVLSPLSAASDAFEFFEWRVRAPLEGKSLQDYVQRELARYADEGQFSVQAGRVQELIATIRTNGAQPLAIVYPYLDAPTQAGPQRVALDRILKLFHESKVPALDVSRLVDVNDRRYHANRFDPHPGPQLNAAVASAAGPLIAGILRQSASRPSASRPST
jgi:hypothetical protein